MTLRLALAAALLLTATAPAGAAEPAEDDLGRYGLDGVSREVAPKGKLKCPDVELTPYAGDVIRYHKPTRVYVGFAERLRRFERVVRDVALEVYGRAPTRIRHIGTYNCRRIGRYPHLISEHGMGNAIDVAGFRFGRLKRGEEAPEGLPKALRRGFEVTVLKHWEPGRSAASKLHSRFLKEVAERLSKRPDIFRVLLGPAYPGHKDHFHFDCASYRLIVL